MADPLTIDTPESTKCYVSPLSASGQYDGNATLTDEERTSTAITWTVKATLTIPGMIPGFPGYSDEQVFGPQTNASGPWNVSFTVPAGSCGPNASIDVNLFASDDPTTPRASKTVANFSVLGSCPAPGSTIHSGGSVGHLRAALGRAQKLAVRAGAATDPPPPLYWLFTGTTPAAILPAVARVECFLQREFFPPTPPVIVSGNRADLLPGGQWGVPLFVPPPVEDTQDVLYVTWYTIGGIAIYRDQKKFQ